MSLPAPQLRESAPPYPARRTGVLASIGHAWNGLVHTVVHQRNMRIHVIAAVLVGLVGSGIPLGLAQKVTLIFCVLLVFFAEILNSALEHLVDLAVQQLDEKARLAKDAAAAGVLVLAIGTVVIFAAILVDAWGVVTSHLADVRRQVIFGLPLAVLAAVLISPWRKPGWVDALLFLAALGLLGWLIPGSASSVFSAMTFGLLVLCGASALARRREGRTTSGP